MGQRVRVSGAQGRADVLGRTDGACATYQAALEAATRNGPRWASGKLLERLARENKAWEDL